MHSSPCFASSFMQLRNDPKCIQTLCKAPKHEFRVQSGRDFVAWTFALIAPVHTVLHLVSCYCETIPNTSKHYETHQNMSLGSNGVDQVRWLPKITTRLRGTTFCINCTSSVLFCNKFHAVMKRSQMHPNTTKCTETLVLDPLGSIGCVRCEKSRRDFVARTFTLIAPVHSVLHRVSCSYETIPNAPKQCAMHQKMSLGSNGVDCVSS